MAGKKRPNVSGASNTMGGAAFKNKDTEARILARRVEVVDLTLKGHTAYAIAKQLGISDSQVARDFQAVVVEWRQQYLEDMDKIKSKEVHRIEQLIAAHWEEFEISKWREIPAKYDKKGNEIAPATKKRVVGNLDYLVAIRECMLQLWKLYGIAQDINISATQNNLNVGKPNTAGGDPSTSYGPNNPQLDTKQLFHMMMFGAQQGSAAPAPVDGSLVPLPQSPQFAHDAVDLIEVEIAKVLGESPPVGHHAQPDANGDDLQEVDKNGDGR